MTQSAASVWGAFARLPRLVRVVGWILGFWILPVVWLAARGTTASTSGAVAFLLLVTAPSAVSLANTGAGDESTDVVAAATTSEAPQRVDPATPRPASPATPEAALTPTLEAAPTPSSEDSATPDATPSGSPPDQAGLDAPALLQVQRQIDGDSFVASDGVEYRVSMINTPERGACGDADSSQAGYALLDQGFTVAPTGGTTYGRTVAVVTLADGRGYGVTMAAQGMVDDRYLDEFRNEAPDEARQLDEAFASARAAGAGLWSTCWGSRPAPTPRPTRTTEAEPLPQPQPTVAPQPLVQPVPVPEPESDTGCHPAYVECIPVGPDLDCADIGHQVHLTGQDDPFRLDGNNTHRENGIGCESY